MSYVVCTLFEKHFHRGLAALSNSLYKKGFRGWICAGYRGNLPSWAKNAKAITAFEWEGGKTLDVAEGLQIHFLPIETEYHFTKYKPTFMLRLFDGPAKDADGLAYLDPDIIVRCEWAFFEYWMGVGVAIVHEVISNDMPASHPIRRGWEKLIIRSGRTITSNISSYINGGFCGVKKANIEFLIVWSEFLELAFSEFGDNRTNFKLNPKTTLFSVADQDALNIAAMCCGCPISEMGPEAMDFVNGGWTLSHATNKPKPWNKNFLGSALRGHPPTPAEKNFWRNVTYPIVFYPKKTVVFKRFCLTAASFIGRFYSRH
ncbi:MAG: hypothetical protein ABIN94_18995 [Ferruginibacter sp.]